MICSNEVGVMFHMYWIRMLPRNRRLRGKDISYITRKKYYFTAGFFSFMYVPQYPQRHYNQFAVHAGLDVSRKAVIRHRVKRVIIAYIANKNFVTQAYGSVYYKVFITCSKAMAADWKKLFAQADKNTISTSIVDNFSRSYLAFSQRLCN